MSRLPRQCVVLLLICSLLNLQASAVSLSVATSRSSLTAPAGEWLSLASWHTGRYLRRILRPQTGISLDTLRATTPNLPDAPGGTNTPPPAGYDDPKPVSTANFSSYFTNLVTAANDTGIAGSRPLQNADPTAGNAVTGGLSVNLDSGNFSFTAPVLALPGRAGLNLSLSLTYNSKIWSPGTGGVSVFNADKGFPGPGWRLFGAIQGISNGGNIGPYANSTTGRQSFIYIAADGTRHDLAYNSVSGLYESYDASWLDFNAATKVLRATDGTKITFGVSATASGDFQLLPTQIKDRHGNFITIAYKTLSSSDSVVDYLLDTLGRRIDFYYENNRLREIRQDRGGVLWKYVIISYQPVTISFDPQNLPATDPAAMNGAQIYLPARITYPTGHNLRFAYTTRGQIWKIEKWVPGIAGQGAERVIAQTSFNYSDDGYTMVWPDHGLAFAQPLTGYWFNQRTEWAENQTGSRPITYQFGIYGGGGGVYNRFHTVTWDNEYRIYYGAPLERALKIVTTYPAHDIKEQKITFTDTGGVPGVSPASPVVSSTYTYDYAISQARSTSIGYTQQHGVWLPTTKDESDTTGAAVYRRTETTYTSYPAQRLIGLPAQVSVYAGAGTTLVARTSYAYDETTTFTDSGGQVAPYFIDETPAAVVQHDHTAYNGSFTQRGNQTTVTQYAVTGGVAGSPRIVKRTAYDTNGNVRSVTDGAGNRSQLLYTDNFSNKPGTVGATQAYVYTAADPTGFRKGSQYNYWNGALLSSFNLTPGSSTPQQTVTTTYDFADRPLQTTRPDGGWVKTGYWDNALCTTILQKTDTVGGVDQTGFSCKKTDGAGRVLQQGSDHPSAIAGKYSGQKFIYDYRGLLTDQSNVTAMDAYWLPIDEDAATGWLFRHHVFDELGRIQEITHPDNSRYTYDRTGCGCAGNATLTTTDERGCKVKTETDFAGRLSKSSEQRMESAPGGSYVVTYNTAVYTYDVLDHLTQIEVGAGESGQGGQPRTFVYDGYGRLQSETTPEAGTVTYTYKPNDLLWTKTDARGKTTTFTYNTRNLVTGLSYNDSGATPPVSYGYDEYGARTTMTDGEGTMNYYYNSLRQLDHETRTFTALTGRYYRLSYAYNQANQVKQVVYAASTTAGALAPGGTAERIAGLAQPVPVALPGSATAAVSPGGAAGAPAPATAGAAPALPGSGGRRPQVHLRQNGRPASAAPALSYSLSPVGLFSHLFVGTARPVTSGDRNGHRRTRPAVYSINGTARTAQGQGLEQATVTAECLSGQCGFSQVTTTTGYSGEYSFQDLPESSTYRITVTKTGFSMSPAAQDVYLSYDAWNVDFTATLLTYSISGTVTNSSNQPVSGVTLTLTGSSSQTTTTNASGQYTFSNLPYSGSFTITPAKSGQVFTPASRSYTNLTASQTGQNFSAAPATPPTGAQTWSRTISYRYNAVGALASIGTDLIGSDPTATTNVISSLSYRAFGATSVVNYGNGRRLTLGYDTNRHQMVSMLVDNQNGTDRIIDKTYYYTTQSSQQTYYDNDGRIKQITDNLDPNYTATYTYDAYNRLETASAGAGGSTYYRRYSYDPWGNLSAVYTTADSQNATIHGLQTNGSGAPATNRISSVSTQLYGWTTQTVNYTWDASGNLTNDGLRTYTYDAAGRQKEAGAVGQNTSGYDGDGQRVKKIENWGTPIYYVRSSVLKQAAMEVQGGTLARAYVYAGGQAVACQGADGVFYWIHTDHLGSGRKLTNTSGAVVYRGEFDPYGQMVLETGSALLNSRRFTGYERDQATGLDYAGARMYTGNAARFTSPDPAGLKAVSLKQPESLNRYAYAWNDPVNHVDPGGMLLAFWECTFGPWHYQEVGDYFWRTFSCSLTILGGYGDGRGGGGDSGGSGSQWPRFPIPNDMKDRMKKKLDRAKGSCLEFVNDLMAAAGDVTGRSPFQKNALDLVDKISRFDFSTTGYSTVSGSFENGDAAILLQVRNSQPDNQKMYNGIQDDYVQAAIHELLHLSGSNGGYGDYDLARAVNNLGILNADQKKELEEIGKLSGDEQVNKSGAFWDKFLQEKCK